LNRQLAFVFVLAAGLLACTSAFATSVVLLDLETHLSESTAVVEAVVGSSRTSLDPRTERPVTDVSLDVTSVLYGSAPIALTIRQLKGRVGDTELHFPGAGHLVEGTRVLLFVVHAEGHWWLTALAQSVYEVSGQGKDALAVRHLDELHLFYRDPDLGVLPIGPLEEPPTRLTALRTRIRVVEGR
jgi:hypothetical protein